MRETEHELHLLREILYLVKEDRHILRRIINHLNLHVYTIRLKETNMAIGSLTSPGTASILLALLDNGSPYVAPEGSTYTFSPTLTSSDTLVTIAPDATVPDQFDVTIPAGDTSASVTFTASATAPDGTTATGTLSVPFAAVAQKFSISVTQSA